MKNINYLLLIGLAIVLASCNPQGARQTVTVNTQDELNEAIKNGKAGDEIIMANQAQYKLLEPFGEKLNFLSMNEFSNSFLLQLKHLDFEEI